MNDLAAKKNAKKKAAKARKNAELRMAENEVVEDIAGKTHFFFSHLVFALFKPLSLAWMLSKLQKASNKLKKTKKI